MRMASIAATVLVPLSCAETRAAPQPKFIKEASVVVCSSIDDAETYTAIVRQHDWEGVRKFVREAKTEGRCWTLDGGTDVFVMKRTRVGTDSYECLRAKGETRCGWDYEG